MRKNSHHSPAVRARMSAAIKKALADPAVRAKMSAASKKAWAKQEGDCGICVECLAGNCLLCDGGGCMCAACEAMDRIFTKQAHAV